MTSSRSASRVPVTVQRETKKALMIKAADGREGWIQRRWLRADGTVADSTLARAAEDHAARQGDRARAQAERDFRNEQHTVSVARRTEKAVASTMVVLEIGGDEATRLCWFPLSCCTISDDGGHADVPGWLIRAKEEEVEQAAPRGGYYERHRWCKGERTRIIQGVVAQ